MNKRLMAKKHWQLYLLLLLPLIWLVVFKYIPMYGIIVAFKKFNASKGILHSQWVGLKYFTKFFQSYYFERTVVNTIGVSVYQLVAGFPIPIILALMMNSNLRPNFTKIVQQIIYMPHFISVVVLVGLVIQVLNPNMGVVNKIIQLLGGPKTDYLGQPHWFKSIYVFSGIWQNSGWGTIVYLATLSSIPTELHEAANIDGANRFMRIIHIDFPGILPTATILLIMNMGRLMQVGFEKVFLLQNPLNLVSSEIIATFVYKVGLASDVPNFSYATAIGLFLSVINLFLIISVNQIARRMGETSLW